MFSRAIDGVYQRAEATNFTSNSATNSLPHNGEEEVSLTSLDQTVGGKENCEANPEQSGEGEEKYPSIGTIFPRAFSPLPKNPRRRRTPRYDWQYQPPTYRDPFTIPTPSTFLGTQTNSFVMFMDQTYGPWNFGISFNGGQPVYGNLGLGSTSDQYHQPSASHSDGLNDSGQEAKNVNHGQGASGYNMAQGNEKNDGG